MNTKTGIMCSLLLTLLLLCGCHNDLDTPPAGRAPEGLPVQFTARCPQDGFAATRAGSPIEDKTEFMENDVIHVTAKFYESEEDATPIIKYATLKLNSNNEWVNEAAPDIDMSWPWKSKYAEFTAYHHSEWNGPLSTPLEGSTSTTPVLLDRWIYQDKTFNPDPLKATARVDYGQAVHLQFIHLCTRLTIVGVDNEDEYWLKFKDGADKPLKNSYHLIRNSDNTLLFEFIPQEDNDKIIASVFDTGEEDGQKAVTFHLAPSDYHTFSLTRRNNYGYITIANVEELKGLEENTPYRVSIEELLGNITQDDDDEDDWWDGKVDPMPEGKYFNVQDFMNAISTSDTYSYTGEDGRTIPVLEKEPYGSEVKLIMDVDFNGADFNSVDLKNTASFNGNHHAISGVKHPLFNSLEGAVSHLRITNADLTIPNLIDTENKRNWGILACTCSGKVQDVSLANATMTVKIQEKTAATVHNIGLLVGESLPNSNLSGISFSGNLDLSVNSSESDDILYSTNVGGVVGQCTNILEGVHSTSRIKVTNRCKGFDNRCTGGIVGLVSGGSISNSDVSATVDASGSIGTLNYTGGVAGTVRTTSNAESTAFVHFTTVNGDVTGGPVKVQLRENGHSATGGIIGHVQNSSVTECSASTNVSIGKYGLSAPAASEYYSIGGCMGSIVTNKAITGNAGQLSFNAEIYQAYGKHYHAGRFAGVGDEALEKDNTAEGKGPFIAPIE